MIRKNGWIEEVGIFPIANNIFVRASTNSSFSEPVENKYGYFSFDDLFLLIPYRVTEMNNEGSYEQKIKRLSDAPLSKKRISLRYALNLMSNHEASRLFEKGLDKERDDFQDNDKLDVFFFKKKRLLHVSLSLIFCMLLTEKEAGRSQTKVLSENNKVIKSSEKIEKIYMDFHHERYFTNELYDDIKTNYFNSFRRLYKSAQDALEIFMQNIESRDLYLFENYEELRQQSLLLIEKEQSNFENCVHKNEKTEYSEIEKYIESYLIDFEYRYEKKSNEENAFLQGYLGTYNKNINDKFQGRTTLNSINQNIKERKQMIKTTSERVKQHEIIMNSLISSTETFRMGIAYLITKNQFELGINRLQVEIIDKTSIESVSELNSVANDFKKIMMSREYLDEKKVKDVALKLGSIDLSLVKQCIAELYSEPFDNILEEYILQEPNKKDYKNEKEKVKHDISLLFVKQIKDTIQKKNGRKNFSLEMALVENRSAVKHSSSFNTDDFHSYYKEFSDLLIEADKYPRNIVYAEEFRELTNFLAHILSFGTLKRAREKWINPFFEYIANGQLSDEEFEESKLGIKKFIRSLEEKNEESILWELVVPQIFFKIFERICQPFDREALKIANEISKENTVLLAEVNTKFPNYPKIKELNEEIKQFREPFYRNDPNFLGSPEYKISSTIQLVYEKRFNKILTRLTK